MPDVELRRAQIRKAETALWDFFVEWSQIAHAAIKEPRLLEFLGFLGGAVDDGHPGPIPSDEKNPTAAAPVTQVVRRPNSTKTARKQGR